MQKFILDTDIGDDIDDALALGFLLKSPEVELLGITTVFKNTHARARQALSLLKVAGVNDIPVAAGCGVPISPYLDLEFNPQEAYLKNELPNQDSLCLSEDQLENVDSINGVDMIIETILNGAGDVSILTIGPMTNIAMAMIKEPRLESKIKKIVAMAGCFKEEFPEWNVRCDPVAAAIVCKSQIPIDFIGLDVTMQVKLSEDQIEQLKLAANPLARKLFDTIATWQAYVKAIEPDRTTAILPIFHDPLAAATIVDPSIVEWQTGEVSVELNKDKTYGGTFFQEKATGRHRFANKVNAQAMISLWLERITKPISSLGK